MIQKIVDNIIDKQVKNKIIVEEEINIYRYGYFLLLEVLINIIISFFIGIVFKDINTVLIFLILYIPLRTYSGGWHANKLWKCTFISSMILVLIEIISNYCLKYVSLIHCIPIVVMCYIYILLVSPIDTESKLLSEEEKKVYKKKVGVIIFVHIFIFLFFVYMKYEKSIIVVEYVYLIQVLMLVIEKISQLIKMQKLKKK